LTYPERYKTNLTSFIISYRQREYTCPKTGPVHSPIQALTANYVDRTERDKSPDYIRTFAKVTQKLLHIKKVPKAW